MSSASKTACRKKRNNVDQKYFEKRFLEELKIEGYRINKMLNGYISYLKERKRGTPTNMSTIPPNQLINKSPNKPINQSSKQPYQRT